MTLSPDASYLMSGGMGALGLVTAQALAEEGAKSLLLMSRRGGFQSWRAEKVCLFRMCGPRIGILWTCCFQRFLLEISEMELPCELDLLTGLIPLTNLASPFWLGLRKPVGPMSFGFSGVVAPVLKCNVNGLGCKTQHCRPGVLYGHCRAGYLRSARKICHFTTFTL